MPWSEITLLILQGDYVIPCSHTATKPHRVFLMAGHTIWNNFPAEPCSLPGDLSGSFYSLLKTFLFVWAWAGSAHE